MFVPLLIGSLFLLMYLSVILPFGVALDGSLLSKFLLLFVNGCCSAVKPGIFGSNFASQCCRSVVSN